MRLFVMWFVNYVKNAAKVLLFSHIHNTFRASRSTKVRLYTKKYAFLISFSSTYQLLHTKKSTSKVLPDTIKICMTKLTILTNFIADFANFVKFAILFFCMRKVIILRISHHNKFSHFSKFSLFFS